MPSSSMKNPSPSRGRRKGASEAKGEIVTAARELFAEHGYTATSMRAVARRASVDPALVHHYFDGKSELFAATMQLGINPGQILARVTAGDRDVAGEAVARSFFGIWDDPQRRIAFVAMARSALSSPEASRALGEFLSTEIFERVVVAHRAVAEPAMVDHQLSALEGAGQEPTSGERLRAGLAASQMLGLGIMRYVVEMPAVRDASLEDLVELLAPTLQHYLVAD